jgi:DNA polymerase
MAKIDLPFVDYEYPEKKSKGLIAIIGEAPGAEEVKQGHPFVGRSGKMLDKNLEAVGIDRKACLVANVFRYQPPKNKVDHFFLSQRKAKEAGEELAIDWGKLGSYYSLKKFAGELEHLRATLKKLKPRVIITLGRTPLWALTGKEGITTLRGQVQPCHFMKEVPVIPTFHPSYIMRGNWSEEKLLKQDLAQARDI